VTGVATTTGTDTAGVRARTARATGAWLRTGTRLMTDNVPEPGSGRVLYVATLINSTGTGMFLASSALFFTRCVGLSAASVGTGLSLGALIGLAAGVPVGALADRRGPREVYACTLAIEATAMTAFVFVHAYWLFVVIATLTGTAATASYAARGPLVRVLGAARPTLLRARIRSATNLGIAIGGLGSAAALEVNTRSAYLTLVLLNAASFAACSGCVLRLPRAPATKKQGEKTSGGVWRDRPYAALTALNLVLMMQYPVLTLVLPLWIFDHTRVPHVLAAIAIPLNTLMVTVLQVRLTRGIESPTKAARVMVRAGLALLVSLTLMAAAAEVPTWLAIVLVPVSTVVYTLGEIWFSGAGYELSFELARQDAQGEYQGFYAMGGGLGRAVSTSVVTFACLVCGFPGWLLFGGLLLAAALPTPWVVGWAQRRTLESADPEPAV